MIENRTKVKKVVLNKKKLNFVRHTGETCPVSEMSWVVYTTTSPENRHSHVHVPMLAGDLIWTNGPHMGRIFEYAVVG